MRAMDVVCGLPLIPHSFDLSVSVRLSMIDGLDDDDDIDTTAMPLLAPIIAIVTTTIMRMITY